LSADGPVPELRYSKCSFATDEVLYVLCGKPGCESRLPLGDCYRAPFGGVEGGTMTVQAIGGTRSASQSGPVRTAEAWVSGPFLLLVQNIYLAVNRCRTSCGFGSRLRH
jgi:hypothetical protein